MATISELAPMFRKTVTLFFKVGEASDGSTSTTDVTGKVLEVRDTGVVIRYRGNARVIELADITSFEEVVRPRKKRVARRPVRRIPADVSVKQHLADRHGILVSVLNGVGDDTALTLHEKINHTDLGHYHREPEEILAELDQLEHSEDDCDDD